MTGKAKTEFFKQSLIPALLLALVVISPASAGEDIPSVVPVYVQASDVVNKVTHGGKPVMLVVYASWCGPCKRSLADVVGLIRQHRLDFVQPVFVSLDADPTKLLLFLLKNHLYKAFAPYALQKGGPAALSAALAPTGSHFTHRIPYTAFYDAHGKMVADVLGAVDTIDLLTLATKAYNK